MVPWLVDRLDKGVVWQAMAWWIHDHLPYSELQLFLKLAAFNIGWHEFPRRRISSFAPPQGVLTKPGLPNHDGDHSDQYRGFPPLELARCTLSSEPSEAAAAVNSGDRCQPGNWKILAGSSRKSRSRRRRLVIAIT